MPSFCRFRIAPVGQALMHHASSQWKQGMKTYRIRGSPPTSTGPTMMILQGAGPAPRPLLVVQWTSQAWHPMQFAASWWSSYTLMMRLPRRPRA